MRKFFAAVLFLSATLAVAQSKPSAPMVDFSSSEFFGGYDFLHTDYKGPLKSENGLIGAYTYFPTSRFGITVQGSYEWASSSSHTYGVAVGPRFNITNRRLQPFVHGLFGAFQSKETQNGITNTSGNFGAELGGGVNYELRHFSSHLGWRVVEVDWEREFTGILSPHGSDHFRFATGLNVRF